MRKDENMDWNELYLSFIDHSHAVELKHRIELDEERINKIFEKLRGKYLDESNCNGRQRCSRNKDKASR